MSAEKGSQNPDSRPMTTPALQHNGASASLAVKTVTAQFTQDHQDLVVVEEPLEIRLVSGPDDARCVEPFSITMRTPGDDFALVAGLLFTEGVIASSKQIRAISYFGQPQSPGQTSNIVRIELKPDVCVDLDKLPRHLVSNSSCGVCGKASLESLYVQGLRPLDATRLTVSKQVVHAAARLLDKNQVIFGKTGGSHGVGLMDENGGLVDVCEDVGRHNAVDKLVGRRFLAGETPLADHAMLVSGRVSFEIAQKALVAGIPMLIAIGAPTSLAVEMAQQFGLTLIGFASQERFNIYSSPQRVIE